MSKEKVKMSHPTVWYDCAIAVSWLRTDTFVLYITCKAITAFQATEIHLQTFQDWTSLYFMVKWNTFGLLSRAHLAGFL